jgi:hypothetical protein
VVKSIKYINKPINSIIIMAKKIFLVGSDHRSRNYEWLETQIRDILPDCITLEAKLGRASHVYWAFKDSLDKSIEDLKTRGRLGVEFSVGVHYARKNNIPVFSIDESYPPFNDAIFTNMNEGKNYEMLHQLADDKKIFQDCNDFLSRYESDFDDNGVLIKVHENLTRRNIYMAMAINYHAHISGFDKMVHIGGRGHYDKDRCIPLQDLIVADTFEILDMVNKKREQIIPLKNAQHI